MSVKKLALLGVASVATLGMSVSLAGGPAHHHSHHDSGLYVGFDVGAKYNTTLDKTVAEWDLVDDDTGTKFDTKNTPWGLTYGVHLGYQVDSHWSVELEFDHDAEQKADYGNDRLDHYKFQSHELAFGLKRHFHLNNELDGYMEIGAAHTNQKLHETYMDNGEDAVDLKKDFWSPMGAFGVTYAIGHDCNLDFEYAYVMGSTSTDLTSVEHTVMGASTQRLTVGIGYHFDV